MAKTTIKAWVFVVLALIGVLALSACGDDDAQADGLPALRPSVTAVPPSTPTNLPPPAQQKLAPVNWENVDHFYAAMLPQFASDVDAFVDRNRYYIEATLTFKDATATIQGAQRVRYTNRTEDTLSEVVFRLYPNMSALAGRMLIHSTTIDDAEVETRLVERETALVVPLDEPLAPGEMVEIALQFTTVAERGIQSYGREFGYQKDVFSAPEWYPVLSVYESGAGWWTLRPVAMGDASYIESGLYEIKLTTPENMVFAISGSEIDEWAADDGMVTHHIVSGPMRDSTLVASPVFGKLTDEVDGVTVNVFFYPGGEPAAEEALEIAVNAIHILSETFGQYPFSEFDVVESFHVSAMEYPGLILISDEWWERGNRNLEAGAVHEVGHQWFFSQVGNDQVGHPWLDESLTNYTEYAYYLEIHGEEDLKDYIQGDRDWYNYYLSSGAPDLVLDLPVSSYSTNSYGPIIYGKGPLFYLELERLIGKEPFLEALRTYVKTYRYEVVTSGDLLRSLEESTGMELDEYFYQWVGEFDGLDPDVVARLKAQEN